MSFTPSRKNEAADVDGVLSSQELLQLSELIHSLPEDALIVEIAPGAGQLTVCLAAACKGTKRSITTIFPHTIHETDHPASTEFVRWHQNILRKHVAPYVRIITARSPEDVAASLRTARAVIVGSDPASLHTAISTAWVRQTDIAPGAAIVSIGAGGTS